MFTAAKPLITYHTALLRFSGGGYLVTEKFHPKSRITPLPSALLAEIVGTPSIPLQIGIPLKHSKIILDRTLWPGLQCSYTCRMRCLVLLYESGSGQDISELNFRILRMK